MGANFIINSFAGEDKSAIEKEWNGAVEASLYEDGHSYSGCIGMFGQGIDWADKPPFENELEGADYIEENQAKWDRALGVQYKNNADIWSLVGGWVSC